jgi:DNA mismatch repair protein MutS
VANYSVAVKEWNEQIILLRKVVEGAADKSYGIQVAKLAGIPRTIIDRAREILITLERKERDVVAETQQRTAFPPVRQLGLFGDPRELDVINALRALDVESMTPIDALNEIARLKSKLS